MMKRLKRGVIAFLTGEFLMLMKKDEQFKKGVMQKTGREKIKHILDGLYDFNTQLFDDIKDQVEEKTAPLVKKTRGTTGKIIQKTV